MSRLNTPLRASLLALALAAAPLPVLAADTADTAAAADIQLAAGPLGRSLSTFASQRGIALSFDPALTAGLRAPALRGRYGNRDGLEQLLAGSGLRLVERADGSYGLDKATGADGVIALAPLRIGGQQTFPYAEGIVLDKDYIEQSVKGNGDIATLLRINPAVQFSENTRTSRNMGEIRPADISINGAPYYQNLFLLDGASFNNDIDPASNIGQKTSNNVNEAVDVPSASQGIALDVDLIESLTVYDSNVPASYGSFIGGVVEARSRDAGDALSGKIWFRMARSAWDDILVPEGAESEFLNSANHLRQLHYDKQKLGLRLEGRTSNGIGLIGSVLRTRSEIPLRAYTNGNTVEGYAASRTQVRENTAYTLAADWRNDSGLELGANLSYAPTDDRYFIQNQQNAWFDLKSGGPVMSLRANLQRGIWTFRNTLSYSDMESSRRSEVDYYKVWARSDQYSWGTSSTSIEGSWGNVDQHDRKIGYRFSASTEPLHWGASEHSFEIGASYQHRKASYERLNDHVYYLNAGTATTCTYADGSVDTDSCSLSPVWASTSSVTAGQGQYLRRQMLYHAGTFEVSGRELAAWIQDDIRIGNWSLRPGLRVDNDDIWSKTTVSPRLAASWDVFGNQDTVLTAGVNRYHGRNFFSYLMREGRERLLETKTRASLVSWDSIPEGTRTNSTNRLTDVDIPHTDEWTLGWSQRWAGMDFSIKYVNRDNSDEVRRQQVLSNDSSGWYSNRVYEYTNNGRSRSDTWTLSVGPQQPLRWLGTTSDIRFAFDHTELRRNFSSYEDLWTETGSDQVVLYKGALYALYDLPATDFNRPWTARLSTQTRFDGIGLTWSNFLRYRAGFRDIAKTGTEMRDGQSYDVYDAVDYPKSWMMDTALEYALDLPHEQQTYVRVEANNVLNRRTVQSGTSSSSIYEPGRSYWLELGYRF